MTAPTMSTPAVRLQSVFCRDCGSHMTTVALQSGPQIIRHQSKFTKSGGERVNCRGHFVAVPDPDHGRVNLIPVEGRHQADDVLRTQTTHWLEHLALTLGADPADGMASE